MQTTECPYCRGQVQFHPHMANQLVACPFCGQHFQMPPVMVAAPVLPAMPQRDDDAIFGRSSIDPGLSLIVSFLLPGLTQIILGQTAKGLFILIDTFVLCFFTLCIGFVIICPIAMLDGYGLAKKVRSGRSIKQWEWGF